MTQRNLTALEEMVFEFSQDAEVYLVQQWRSMGRGEDWHGVPGRVAKSFVVRGTGSDGEEVEFVRRESRSPEVGQTLVYIDGKRHRLKHLLSGI